MLFNWHFRDFMIKKSKKFGHFARFLHLSVAYLHLFRISVNVNPGTNICVYRLTRHNELKISREKTANMRFFTLIFQTLNDWVSHNLKFFEEALCKTFIVLLYKNFYWRGSSKIFIPLQLKNSQRFITKTVLTAELTEKQAEGSDQIHSCVLE